MNTNLVCRPLDKRASKAVEKYSLHGFEILPNQDIHECGIQSFRSNTRRIGDDHSWILSLDTNGVEPLNLGEQYDSHDPMQSNTWRIRRYLRDDSNEGGLRYDFRISFRLFENAVLQFIYAMTEETKDHSGRYVSALRVTEFQRLSTDHKVAFLGEFQGRMSLRHPKPSFWE